jgi:SAM-dependent methyltransferase
MIYTCSHSSSAAAGARQKFHEALTFLSWRLRSRSTPDSFKGIINCIEGYRSTYEHCTGLPFQNARVLEIGFGARPNRLIGMMSIGIDVRGIDLDIPMLGFELATLMRILKTNGPERALKTLVRSALFDGRDRRSLAEALRRRGYQMNIDRSRFLVGDAAEYEYGSDGFDFIYSEDVFEHIPAQALERLVPRLAQGLRPGGIAVVKPNIFTGIAGGHLPDWYSHIVDKDLERKSEPWEHLRKKRYIANTYLNHLSRAGYRELFNPYFEILEETVMIPDLGRRWLTPEVKAELAHWDDDELFSNQVRFVLRVKEGARQASLGS